jgi:hypothetical protein
LGKWVGSQIDGFNKFGGKGFDELAKGMTHTHNQEAAAQFVERVVGRWGKMSPKMRAGLIHAPFVQWLGVALKYVYVTLPVHHPIKTAIFAGLNEMNTDELKKLGLYVDPFTTAGRARPEPAGRDQVGPGEQRVPGRVRSRSTRTAKRSPVVCRAPRCRGPSCSSRL